MAILPKIMQMAMGEMWLGGCRAGVYSRHYPAAMEIYRFFGGTKAPPYEGNCGWVDEGAGTARHEMPPVHTGACIRSVPVLESKKDCAHGSGKDVGT